MGAMDPEGNSSNDLGGDLKLEQMATDSATYADMLQYTRGASINYLPVELLLLIFKVLAEEHPDSLCSLLRVNKQWHSILSSEHVAWQNLVMNDAEFGDGSTLRGMAKMWKEASRVKTILSANTEASSSVNGLHLYAELVLKVDIRLNLFLETSTSNPV